MSYTFTLDPHALSDREREAARWHPERETIILAAAGAAKVLGPDHSATRAFAKAERTMDRVDLWHARQAMKTPRRDQREAISGRATPSAPEAKSGCAALSRLFERCLSNNTWA